MRAALMGSPSTRRMGRICQPGQCSLPALLHARRPPTPTILTSADNQNLTACWTHLSAVHKAPWQSQAQLEALAGSWRPG